MSEDTSAERLFMNKMTARVRNACFVLTKFGRARNVDAAKGASIMVTILLDFAAGIARSAQIPRVAFLKAAGDVFDREPSDEVKRVLQ